MKSNQTQVSVLLALLLNKNIFLVVELVETTRKEPQKYKPKIKIGVFMKTKELRKRETKKTTPEIYSEKDSAEGMLQNETQIHRTIFEDGKTTIEDIQSRTVVIGKSSSKRK